MNDNGNKKPKCNESSRERTHPALLAASPSFEQQAKSKAGSVSYLAVQDASLEENQTHNNKESFQVVTILSFNR